MEDTIPTTEVKDMAFTIYGVSYDHGLPAAEYEDCWLHVRGLKAGKLGKLQDTDTATPLDSDEWEFEETPEDYDRLLWVALFVPDAAPTHKAKFSVEIPGFTGRRRLGRAIYNVDDPLTVPRNDRVFRVGVCNEGTIARFYAMADASHGICEGRLVDFDRVFVFPNYRDKDDMARTVEQRRERWSAKPRQLSKDRNAPKAGDDDDDDDDIFSAKSNVSDDDDKNTTLAENNSLTKIGELVARCTLV